MAAAPATIFWLVLLPLLVVTFSFADDAPSESSEPPTPSVLPPIDMRIVDEQTADSKQADGKTQVDGKTIVRDLGSNLNLTCLLDWTGPPGQHYALHAAPQIAWYIPSTPARDRIKKERLQNGMRLSVTDLRSHDSGNFSCEFHLGDESILLKSFILYVRPPTSCSDAQFQCRGSCIGRVFVCDGKPDCPDGLDEILETCGKHVTCDDDGRSGGGQLLNCGGRCRPRHYCCLEGNCSTGRYINEHEPCCKDVIRRTGQYRPRDLDKNRPRHDDQSGAYDRTYLETAIYTIIGCAVAFILIVSIMIVAFCRVHLRQSARLSTYSHMRAARAAAAHPPLADFDHLMMSGGGAHFPAYYGGGPGHMMVTYNINNGVQVMPLISPPSYSEAVQGRAGGSLEPHRAPAAASSSSGATAQPKNAGPPPPYASRETLAEPAPAYAGSENNNGDINGNSVAEAAAAPAPSPPTPAQTPPGPEPGPGPTDRL